MTAMSAPAIDGLTDVVHIAVAIIVNAVAGDLSRVGPHVCGEVWVAELDARVWSHKHKPTDSSAVS